MKILLIDNNTEHKSALSSALGGHDVEVQVYRPGLDFHVHDKDLVILSGGGGEGQEISDTHTEDKLWYADEMQFVLNCQKPVIGICMGFEVMAKAYGQNVPSLGKLVYGVNTVESTERGWQIFGKSKFKQVEAHSWHVKQAPKGFDELLRSENGVEAIYSQKLKRFATQFHPELGGTLDFDVLIKTTLSA